MFRKKSTIVKEETAASSPTSSGPKLTSFASKEILEFIDSLSTVISSASFTGDEAPHLPGFWDVVQKNKSRATLYITLLAAKIFALESGDDKDGTASLRELADSYKLGSGAAVTRKKPEPFSVLDGKSLARQRMDPAVSEIASPKSKPSAAAGAETFDKAAYASSLLQSLYFSALFLEYDRDDPNLNIVMDLWSVLPQCASQESFYTEVKRAVMLTDKATHLVEMCVNLEASRSPEEVLPQDIDTFDPFNGCTALLYLHLQQRYSYSEETRSTVLEALNTLLRIPAITQAQILAIFHLLRNLLPLAGRYPSAMLEKLIAAIRPMFLWPNPFGTLARDMLVLLQNEVLFPGIAMRQRFESIVSHGRRVHVFVNPNAASFGSFAARALLADNPEAASPSYIPQIKANLVLNLFESLLSAEDCRAVAGLPADLLARHYDSVSKPASCDFANPDKSKADYIAQLQAARAKMLAEAKGAKGEAVVRWALNARLPVPEYKVTVMDVKESLLAGPRVTRTQPKSAYYDVLEAMYKEAAKTATPGKKPCLDLVLVGGSGMLHHYLAGWTVLKSREYALVDSVDSRVYLVPTGAANVLANCFEKFDEWYSRNVASFLMSPFFVVPFRRTSGSAASKSRRLSSFFRSSSSSSASSGPATPDALLAPDDKATVPYCLATRAALDNYLQEAAFPTKVQVYFCICSTLEVIDLEKKQTKIKDFVVLPFCQQVEIGINVAATSSKKDYPELTLAEIQQQKSFKYTPFPLNVSYKPTGVASAVNEDERTYSSVVIKNTPRAGDRGNSPSCPWLTVSLTDFDRRRPRVDAYANDVTIQSPRFEGIEVLIDGEPYGPFQKISIGSKAGKDDFTTFDVMSFLPLDV